MEQSSAQPWHALTPAGVARFARAGLWRLWLAQLAGALTVAVCVIWFCAYTISPIITQTVEQFSEDTQLSSGKLRNVPQGLVTESKFLSVSFTAGDVEEPGIGDVQLLFGESTWKISSILGFIELPYSAQTISLAHSQVAPWWGAWKPAIFVAVGVLMMLFLFFTWWTLAWLYCWLPKLMAFFLDRNLSWKESRRLCGAAQISGAIGAAICIVLYRAGIFDLTRFLFFFSAHLIVDWVYVFFATFFLPRVSETIRANPFAAAEK